MSEKQFAAVTAMFVLGLWILGMITYGTVMSHKEADKAYNFCIEMVTPRGYSDVNLGYGVVQNCQRYLGIDVSPIKSN